MRHLSGCVCVCWVCWFAFELYIFVVVTKKTETAVMKRAMHLRWFYMFSSCCGSMINSTLFCLKHNRCWRESMTLFIAVKIWWSTASVDFAHNTDTVQSFASSLLHLHKCTSGFWSLFLHINNSVPTRTMCLSSSMCFRLILINLKLFLVTEYTLENDAFKLWRMGSICSLLSLPGSGHWGLK